MQYMERLHKIFLLSIAVGNNFIIHLFGTSIYGYTYMMIVPEYSLAPLRWYS